MRRYTLLVAVVMVIVPSYALAGPLMDALNSVVIRVRGPATVAIDLARSYVHPVVEEIEEDSVAPPDPEPPEPPEVSTPQRQSPSVSQGRRSGRQRRGLRRR